MVVPAGGADHFEATAAPVVALRYAEGALWATWWLFPYLTAIGSTQALPVVRGLGIVPILLVVALLWQQRPGRRVARGRAAESLLNAAAA